MFVDFLSEVSLLLGHGNIFNTWLFSGVFLHPAFVDYTCYIEPLALLSNGLKITKSIRI